MTWERSEFGMHLSSGSGIGELMDDLGQSLAQGGDRIRMLGGGQPSHIASVDAIWRERMMQMAAAEGRLEQVLGNYEPPAGNLSFRKAVAELFAKEFGWKITADHVGVTAGGQTALFFLFNSLAGRFADGRQQKVLLPLVPEYIGYAAQSVGGELFCAVPPKIQLSGDHQFKYHVDFDNVNVTDDIAAICVSRPTNPTGNVLTDDEINRLATLASDNNIPLIIDNAYGAPFPNAIFTQATPIWNENIILTLSLSKIGLPGTRTGIVIAHPDLIRSIASMTSIVGLANTNIGQAICEPLIRSGEILRISNDLVQPFYREKSIQTQRFVQECFDDNLPYRVHRSEGAFFLWMWFEDLPITSRELYERLKARDVLVVPGHYFFFGHDDPTWRHRHECIRVSFTMGEDVVRSGVQVIAEVVADAYRQ
ncbi:MAG: valine--pyruvate transaminase [Pirellulaceae bacterium]|nr:valine--pyruvate transaminase [Pirellulaceae bacterium]